MGAPHRSVEGRTRNLTGRFGFYTDEGAGR